MTTVVGVQVSSLAPRRSKRHIVCSDFFQKSERTHFVAPPFQITTAPPDCDLVGKRLSKHSCRLGIRRNKRHTVCPAFFQKSERTHSAAPPFQIATALSGCNLAGKSGLKGHSCRIAANKRTSGRMSVCFELRPLRGCKIRRMRRSLRGGYAPPAPVEKTEGILGAKGYGRASPSIEPADSPIQISGKCDPQQIWKHQEPRRPGDTVKPHSGCQNQKPQENEPNERKIVKRQIEKENRPEKVYAQLDSIQLQRRADGLLRLPRSEDQERGSAHQDK